MKNIVGSCNRILEIDLTAQSFSEFEISKADRRLYLGGKGLGVKCLYDRMQPGVDPLGPDNIMAIMLGVLLGTGAPCSGRFSAVTKSPLTGIFTASSCGGPFGMALKTAGYEGLLVSGRSPQPVWLRIDAQGVEFHDAADLVGKDTFETQAALNLSRKDGALAIGPAGENRVRFANIASGHRFLGRGGMGAVMGAKNLKALVAVGGRFRIVPSNPGKFKKLKKKATRYINANLVTSDLYRNYGTNAGTRFCHKNGILPIHNFRQGIHDKALEVSGEAMREKHKTRYSTCKPCTILCGHKGEFGEGDVRQIPEYETVGMLGFSIGVFESARISEYNDICGRMGMDTISAGATLAWTMEAGEKGLFPPLLSFGVPEGVAETLEKIAHRKEHGDELANGVRYLSGKYGGREFAMHVKGLELSAYDPRGAWGQGLAYAVANRGGCHLSAYLVAMEVFFGLLNPQKTGAKAEFVRFFESVTCCINALHTCHFTMYAYILEMPLTKFTPDFLLGSLMQNMPKLAIGLTDFSLYTRLWSSVTGIRISNREFFRAGDRIHVLERHMNTREGITRKDDRLPERLLKECRHDDAEKITVPLEPMLDRYYRIRGYDKNGVPTANTLERLGILNRENRNRRLLKGYREVRPGSRHFKRWYLWGMLWFVGRALEAASKVDSAIGREVERLPDGFTFLLGVLPAGPSMVVERDDRGRLKYRGWRAEGKQIDLKLLIKTIEAAFSMFTFRESTAAASARNRFVVEGDLAMGCSVVRMMDIVEVYLLPKIAAKRAVKRYPVWGFGRKLLGRIQIYVRAIVGF